MAAPKYQTKQLSAPTVMIDGTVWPIVPNSCVVRIPGDAKVRAMSAGGGAVQTVVGLNVETLVGHVKFEIANTAQNFDRVRALKQRLVNADYSTVTVTEDTVQFAFQTMAMTKDTEAHFKADGNINVEMEGQFVP